MKFSPALILTGLAAVARLSAAAPDTKDQPAPPAPAKESATLLRELTDENYQVRERATKEIWALGEVALPALKEAAASPDPEQAFRARQVLRMVQFHITPDTDPSVIALVERYQKASLSEKAGLLGKMKGKRAWRQMLKLYAAETSTKARQDLKSAVDGISIRAARELLSQGDAKGAREFLEMAPADAEGLMALAAFHRSQGTLDAELERANNLKAKKPAWLLALHRAAGNIPAAREAAIAAGESRIAASMSVLMGDPMPMLMILCEQAGEDDPLSKAYAKIATRRWLGEKIRAVDSQPLIHALGAPDTSERTAAMSAMFMLGDVEAAEQAFMKTNPLKAFLHFDSLERIADAHKALKLDPEKPDYKTWVLKRTENITRLEIEDQHEASTHSEELVTLANFLERRGLHEAAYEAFAEPVTALAGKDDDPFLNFLGELFGGSGTLTGAPRLASRIGFAWAGEDEKRWEDLIAAAFGEDDLSMAWWDWLAELDPKASRIQRFEALLTLFDIGCDPKKLREKWLTLAWKAVDAAPAGEKETFAGRISILGNHAQDVATSLRAWELLSDDERNEVFWGARIVQLSAADRWKEAADVMMEHLKNINETQEEPSDELYTHAYAAACLRLAGNEQEAHIQDQLLDSMALGNAAIAMQIGNGYAFGRDTKRARKWYARAAIETDPDSDGYAVALKHHSDALLEEGRWKETAATSEIVAHSYALFARNTSSPLLYMRQRLQADMARALSILKEDRPAALAILAKCHRTFASDGSLADFFFPALRKVGLIKEHDEWFNDSWQKMQASIQLHPESDNTRNTAAWFATRALRRLDEAEVHLRKALALNPNQPAYLDTMAELQFAKGKRDKAIEWSQRAINFAPDDMQLRQQQDRFRSEPLPK